MMDSTNWVAVVLAAVAYNAVGYAWYSDTLFGKQWRKESGVSKSAMSDSSQMGKMFALMAVSSLLISYVLSVIYNVFQATDISAALTGAFWVWLGFIASVLLNSVTYEGKSWNYFAINAGYQLVGIMVAGVVLVSL